MKKGKLGQRSRIIIIISLLLLIVNVSLGYFLTRQSNAALISQIQGRMLDLANTAADMLNGDELERLTAEDKDNEEYQKVIRTLTCYLENIELEYIYCIKDMGNKQFVFTVDPAPVDPGEFGEPIVYTDALYMASLGTPAVDNVPYEVAWGTFYSAYSPVFDSEGNVAGIVAVDYSADWYENQIAVQTRTVIIVCGMSLLVGALVVVIITEQSRKRYRQLYAQLNILSDNVEDLIRDIGYRFKAENGYFNLYSKGGWEQQFMTGVNIGASEPALFPGDLTISYDTYLRWFKRISEMNANCIRVYTTMRPQFYLALSDFNATAENPLYLFQGIWVNEEDIERLGDVYAENEKIMTDFKNDAITTVNVIHGNAVIPESPGEASGTYHADVSRWLAGWIIGIEWDPNLVLNTDDQHPDMRDYDGEYLFTQSSSPFEAFLCRVGDALIVHETEEYNFQAPLAFTNWITTDPLSHPNEPHYDEDKAIVNTESIKFRNFEPGMFASYHIYPYYPDSLNYQEDYLLNTGDDGKPDTYSAYLKDLKLVHTLPILVAEFGIPTSRGMGHESVMGYNQGGVDENAQGAMLTDMIDSIYETGYAGGLVFTWQDEWFKRTWNNVMFDIADRRPFWSNIQTTEQNFGVMAFDPGTTYCCCYPDGDLDEWSAIQPSVVSDAGELSIMHDERYLYLLVKAEDYDFNNDTLYIPINTIADQGNTASEEYDLTFDDGADFLIRIHGASDSHIYVDRYYDAFNYHYVDSRILSDFPVLKDADEKDSGVFDEMMMCYGYHLTVGGTGVEVPDKAYETGKLKYGNANPDAEDYASLTDFCYGSGAVEIRIPWQLLNVMDPSSKQQMGDFREDQVFTPQPYDSFDFGVGVAKDKEAVSISFGGSYSYQEWNMPTWHERLKPSYYELQEYLEQYRSSTNSNNK